MKRIIILFTVVCLVFSLFACSTVEDSPAQEKDHVHSYSEADCTSPKTCSCGETEGEALGHNYTDATCTSPQICYRCGETKGKELGHDIAEATCSTPKTCKRCGQSSGGKADHSYVDNICIYSEQADLESLPVGLDKLFVIDSENYGYETGAFTDSFGNTHVGAHVFDTYWGGANAVFNLNGLYKTFSGTIVLSTNSYSSCTYWVSIYVNDVLQYTQADILKTTGKIDFEVDVTNGTILKIVTGRKGSGSGDLAIVNAQLTK